MQAGVAGLRLPQRPRYAEACDLLRRAGSLEEKRLLIRELARGDRYALAYMLGYDTEKFPWDELHCWLCDERLPELEPVPGCQAIFLLPRGTYKTTLLVELDTIYRILNNPEIQVLIGSWKGPVAQARTRNIKTHLESPLLRWLFPDILWENGDAQAPKWTEAEFTVKRRSPSHDATVAAFSVEAWPTGLHGDLIKFDDVVEARSVETEDGIEKVKRRMQDAGSLRTGPAAQTHVVGTVWDPDDYHVNLSAHPDWICERHPALVGDPDVEELFRDLPDGSRVADMSAFRPRFPKCLPITELEKMLNGRSRTNFSGQYLQKMKSAEGAIWPASWVQNYATEDDLPISYAPWIVVDLATEGGRDQTAVTLGLALPDGRWFIAGGRAGSFTPTQTAEIIYSYHKKWGGGLVVEEIGGFQFFDTTLAEMARSKGYGIPYTKIDHRSDAKYSRINALDSHYRARRILTRDPATCRDAADRAFFENYERQATRWPMTELKDILDTVADLCKYGLPPQEVKADPEATAHRRGTPARDRAAGGAGRRSVLKRLIGAR